MPALTLDVALVHMNRADEYGNAQYLGPDPYFDDLFCMAAREAYVSTEQIIDTAGLTVDAPLQSLLLNRTMVTGVVETPNGAHFTTARRRTSATRSSRRRTPLPRRRRRTGRRSTSGSCPATRRPTKPPSLRSERRLPA